MLQTSHTIHYTSVNSTKRTWEIVCRSSHCYWNAYIRWTIWFTVLRMLVFVRFSYYTLTSVYIARQRSGARYWYAISVCPSVCVHLWYCFGTAVYVNQSINQSIYLLEKIHKDNTQTRQGCNWGVFRWMGVETPRN